MKQHDSNSGPLRVALVGSGSIARQHLLAYQQFPEVVELVAICDVNEEAATRFAEGAGVEAIFTDLEKLLARPDIDAVDICTPHDHHTRPAIAAAEAGKHVLLEKPMAPTIEECLQIVEAADRAGVTLMVGQHLRHLPAYRAVKRVVESGELGSLWSARADNWLPRAVTGGSWEIGRSNWWGFDGARAGGGVLPMLATHHIDLFRYFFGDVRSVLGHTWTDNPLFKNGAEDRAVATLEFESGVVAHVSASYSTRGPHDYQFMILGDQGTLYTQPQPGMSLIERHQAPAFVWSSRRAKSVEDEFVPLPPAVDEFSSPHPFINEILHFAHCCQSGQEPVSSGRDNLGTMRALLAIYESARTGRMVDVAAIG